MSSRDLTCPYVDDPSWRSIIVSASGARSPLLPVLSVTTYAWVSCGASAADAGDGEKGGSGVKRATCAPPQERVEPGNLLNPGRTLRYAGRERARGAAHGAE